MPFVKGNDKRRNSAGRPKGSRNKKNPNEEFQKAFTSGITLQEAITIVSDIIRNATKEGDGSVKHLSHNELIKYLTQFFNMKTYAAEKCIAEWAKANEEEELKKKESEQKKVSTQSSGNVQPIQFKTKAN